MGVSNGSLDLNEKTKKSTYCSVQKTIFSLSQLRKQEPIYVQWYCQTLVTAVLLTIIHLQWLKYILLDNRSRFGKAEDIQT